MLCMFIIYYMFGTLGDYLFGGKIFVNDIKLIVNPNVDPLYTLMNMNDLLASFITLFALMIVNNWFVIVETFTVVTSNYYWFYFILYYVICANLMITIIVAFVLDMY